MSTENKKDILKMAMIYTQEGRWDKAIGEYKKLLTLDPTDYNIHNMLGDVYAKKEEDYLSYQAYVIAADAYIKQGLADKASVIYKKIGKLNMEKLPDADRQKAMLIKRNTIGEKYIEEGQIEKAIEEYKEILKINPANFDTYQKLGDLYSKKGDPKEALNYYKKIVDVYFKNRLYKRALPIYQKILEMQPDSIVTRERIADICEREGNELDAKREFLYLCEYYWNERNMEKTDYYAQKAIDFKSIEAHFFKGAALAMKKEYPEAKKELEMLLKFKANHAGALLCMAEIQKETGELDEALATLNRLIKGDPESVEGYMMLGDMYLMKSQKKESTEKFLSAVSVFNKRHEYDKSAELMSKILEQDPDNLEILQKYAEILSQLGKKKEAANAYIKVSEVYKKNNMDAKAQEYYKLAQDMDPGNPVIVNNAKKMESSRPFEAQSAKPLQRAAGAATASAALQDAVKQAQQPLSKQEIPPSGGLKIQRGMFYDMTAESAVLSTQAVQRPLQEKKSAPSHPFEPLPETEGAGSGSALRAKTVEAQAPPIPQKSKPVEPLPGFDEKSKKKPSEQIGEMEAAMGLDYGMPQQTKEDVPSLLAMADSLVKTGSYDEAIEMYQKAIAIDPGNAAVKTKLNAAYSRYAGIPIVDQAAKEAEKNKREEAEKSRLESEERKRRDFEALKKKVDEEKKRLEQEAKDRSEKEAAAEDARKKNAEQDEKKKKEEQDNAKRKTAAEQEQAPAGEPQISDDFVTVTTAEIFIKQGLLTEGEKILGRILAKDPDNMEARIKLGELKKALAESAVEEKQPGGDENSTGKSSKVSYI
jgi:tetratricopeptide (TPR) repeat protein